MQLAEHGRGREKKEKENEKRYKHNKLVEIFLVNEPSEKV